MKSIIIYKVRFSNTYHHSIGDSVFIYCVKNVRNKLNLQQFYVILCGCRTWISIVRERHQIGVLRMTGGVVYREI